MKHFVFLTLFAVVTIVATVNWPQLQPLLSGDQNYQAKVDESVSARLTIKGSNTVGENLIPLVARGFLNEQGASMIEFTQLDSFVERMIDGRNLAEKQINRIEVSAHGSSTGFKALLAGTADIGMSSRPIKPTEKQSLEATYGQVNEHPIALDALAITSHSDNPVNSLTIEQIAKIFSGEIDNWKLIGGENLAIQLFSRDNNSGTWDTFKNLVLEPHRLTLSADSTRLESSTELVSMVESTPGAIGFVGAAYSNRGKLIAIAKDANQKAALPSVYTIGTESYPLSRKLFLYTVGSQQRPITKAFIEFATRNEGQKLAERVGLVSYFPTHYSPKNIAKDTPQLYRGLNSLGSRITVNFDRLDKQVDSGKENRDLERLKNFAELNPGRAFVLVGFSSARRLAELESKLASKEINVLDSLNLDYAKRHGDNIEVWVL